MSIKIGMIGLDTSHCGMFVNGLNYEDGEHFVPGGQVVKAFPAGSDQCAVTRDRVEQFTASIRDEHGIEICDSLEEVGEGVDAFLLTSVDGRQHVEQFQELAEFGKPVFIDKPMACSHADAAEIAQTARQNIVPLMSASSIRFANGLAGLVPAGRTVNACAAFGAMSLLDDYPGYFWYGVHGADVLFSYMGRGCRSVQAVHEENTDVLVGQWADGRIGTVRGLRYEGTKFGCTVFTEDGPVMGVDSGEPPCYTMLLREIVRFFETGEPPIDLDETVEIMAFLEAATDSMDAGGMSVDLMS